jgi:DNA-binding winged helix-turn-helix (wHTH) protein
VIGNLRWLKKLRAAADRYNDLRSRERTGQPAVDVSPQTILRFGPFDLDPKSGELRKDGEVIKLQPQPLKVLALLLRYSGEVVTREEIRQQVWSDDTFVDFGQSLNFCIRQIREALGDDAETPQYIQTLPRRGYRFLLPVESSGAGLAPPVTRLIVLPFRMLRPDPEIDFLAFSLPDAVTSSLSGLHSLVVRSSVVASRFGGEPLDPKKIAAEADVDIVLTGSLLRGGDQLRVSTQLTEVPGGTLRWSQTSQVPLGDIFYVQDELASYRAVGFPRPRRPLLPHAASGAHERDRPGARPVSTRCRRRLLLFSRDGVRSMAGSAAREPRVRRTPESGADAAS